MVWTPQVTTKSKQFERTTEQRKKYNLILNYQLNAHRFSSNIREFKYRYEVGPLNQFLIFILFKIIEYIFLSIAMIE